MSTRLRHPEAAAQWLRERVRGRLCTDSRQVQPGDGFIAWPGAATDGRAHVPQALAAGAVACLVEQEGVEAYAFDALSVAAYPGLKAATGPIAATYFGHPSQALQMLAVTGTNGKTSTTWWLAQALSRAGHRCGVVGTLGIGEPGALVPNGLTTPDPVLLQQQLREFVRSGFAACAIEASSIGIVERRLDGVSLDVAVFTNFTQDHLDYHGSMAAYWAAKQALFAWPGLRAAVVNIDDPQGQALVTALCARGLDVWTCSSVGSARLQACNISYQATRTSFDVVESGVACPFSAEMVGPFNVANLLGVMGALRATGISLPAAVAACTDLLPVPGRMEAVVMDDLPLVVIDYAHTPDALAKALDALRPMALQRGGRLWCVFGCGGDRDALKRPLMGRAAELHADHVVITSDNPRSQDPSAIAEQVAHGVLDRSRARVCVDRAAAISLALQQSHACDVVLLAGKGPEDYQDVGGVKLAFSDRDEAMRVLAARRAAQERRA